MGKKQKKLFGSKYSIGSKRKIGGIMFKMSSTHNLKRNAKKEADRKRKLQHRVRVLPDGNFYAVWVSITARKRKHK